MVASLLLLGKVGSGAIQSLADRPKASVRNPFAPFGEKSQCTHYDTDWRKPNDTAHYGPLAEADGAEPTKVFCRNRRSRSMPTGFLCDFHQALCAKGKGAPPAKPSYLIDAREILEVERKAIASATINRIRLVTAGTNSVYLQVVA